jgi:pantoate--beta-alanine ligase
MKILTTVSDLLSYRAELRKENHRVAFVPTMGALHEAHISLVKLAHTVGTRVIVSLFINPSQFNDPKDYEKYPRVLERDCALLEQYGVAAVFAPAHPDQIYGPAFQTWVENSSLGSLLEGASRPGHYRGVTTVVSILFNLVQPEFAIFGEKDYQQLITIERMVGDLKFPVTIVRAPLMREPGGLAMSSRNTRLSEQGRVIARSISRALFIAVDAFKGGERRRAVLRSLVAEVFAAAPGVSPDYIALVNEGKLEEAPEIITHNARILVAVMVEGIRLIDTVELVVPR